MFFLGLQGSPRLKGNTQYLLSLFLTEAEKQGAQTHTVQIDRKNILPCKEYVVCEKKGFCPIKDDMESEIYALLRKADIVVAATPVFFYGFTAQFKALIDRCQTLWARKYRLKLKDPGCNTRKGYLLSVGATRGTNLFEGVKLTATYFFDAIDAEFAGSLTYRNIEAPGDLAQHPTAATDVESAVSGLMAPTLKREKILFICRENTVLSQMAGAFTQFFAGDAFEVLSAGIAPEDRIDSTVETVMAEKGIDMAFRTPRSLEQVMTGTLPDRVVTLGPGAVPSVLSTVTAEHWDLSAPTTKSVDFMRKLRDVIEDRATELIRARNPENRILHGKEE